MEYSTCILHEVFPSLVRLNTLGSAGGMLMRSHLPQIGEELAVLKAGYVVDCSFGSVVSQSSSEVVVDKKEG